MHRITSFWYGCRPSDISSNTTMAGQSPTHHRAPPRWARYGQCTTTLRASSSATQTGRTRPRRVERVGRHDHGKQVGTTTTTTCRTSTAGTNGLGNHLSVECPAHDHAGRACLGSRWPKPPPSVSSSVTRPLDPRARRTDEEEDHQWAEKERTWRRRTRNDEVVRGTQSLTSSSMAADKGVELG